MSNFNPFLSVINIINWKISVGNRILSHIISQFYLIDIYRTIYPTNVEYIVHFSVQVIIMYNAYNGKYQNNIKIEILQGMIFI